MQKYKYFVKWRKNSIFASANVDRFVMIATTRKNAKALFNCDFIPKSVTFKRHV